MSQQCCHCMLTCHWLQGRHHSLFGSSYTFWQLTLLLWLVAVSEHWNMLEGFLEGFSVLGRGITFHFQELLPEQSQTMIRTSSPTSTFFFSRSCRSITASLDVDHIKKKSSQHCQGADEIQNILIDLYLIVSRGGFFFVVVSPPSSPAPAVIVHYYKYRI